jgi:hypothetical protein
MSVCRIENRDRDQDAILGCTSKESGDPEVSNSRSSTNRRPRDSLNECVVARFAESGPRRIRSREEETQAKERQEESTMRNVRGSWLTEPLSESGTGGSVRKKGCEVKNRTSLEGRFLGLLDARKAPTFVLQESQPDEGVTGTPLEREASSYIPKRRERSHNRGWRCI